MKKINITGKNVVFSPDIVAKTHGAFEERVLIIIENIRSFREDDQQKVINNHRTRHNRQQS